MFLKIKIYNIKNLNAQEKKTFYNSYIYTRKHIIYKMNLKKIKQDIKSKAVLRNRLEKIIITSIYGGTLEVFALKTNAQCKIMTCKLNIT